MHLYLTGFMGSGKTSVGRRLAARRGVAFIDLDAAIEEEAGMSIREIFAAGGEPDFRRREEAVLRAVSAGRAPAVIATGGGTVTNPANLELMRRHGLVVWLSPPFTTIVRRIGALGKEDRPLFRTEAEALELYRRRLPAYRRCDHKVEVTAAESAEETAARIELLVWSP
jgi:shikimate kinase